MTVRLAAEKDIPAVLAIYDRILDIEEARTEPVVCWLRGVYPTEATARTALGKGTLYVMEDSGNLVAAAKIDQEQVPEYADCPWQYDAPADKVLVLHTLVVDPLYAGRGYGAAFVDWYERQAVRRGTPYLRMDTNLRNLPARRLYQRLGYTEPGVVGCVFNGIPDVKLVCLEKKV